MSVCDKKIIRNNEHNKRGSSAPTDAKPKLISMQSSLESYFSEEVKPRAVFMLILASFTLLSFNDFQFNRLSPVLFKLSSGHY